MFIVAALFAVFVIILLVSARGTSGCRWREDRQASSKELSYWRCDLCGAQDKTIRGRRPTVCRARTPRQIR